MRPDRDLDWETRPLAQKQQERDRQKRAYLQEVHRVGLLADEATGSEGWDVFLSVLKGRVEKTQKEVSAALEALEKSDDFSPEIMVNQKLAVRLLGREVEILEWVIGLPQELMEQGDQAKELLGNADQSSD